MHTCKGSPELMCSLSLAAIWEPRAAFSKRFVGAGHSEEGAGMGGEGTLLRAHRASTFRGVWGHSASEIF